MAPKESTDTLLARGRQAAKAGDWQKAVQSYSSVLERFPANKRAKEGMTALRATALPKLLKDGQNAKNLGQRDKAEVKLALAWSLAPEITSIGHELGECQIAQGCAPQALATAQALLEQHSTDPVALNFKGRALQMMGRGKEARQCFLAALGDKKIDPHTLTNLGILNWVEGDNPAAVECYQAALALNPEELAIHRNMTLAVKYTPDHPHLQQMRALLAKSDPNDTSIGMLHFCLFQALDQIQDTAAAFSHLEKANRLTRKNLNYDIKQDQLLFALSKTIVKGPIGSPKASSKLRPIFITGLPRSGTTLAERVLSRGKGVQAAGELTIVQNAVIALQSEVIARKDKRLVPQDITALRERLLLDLEAYSDGSPVIVDKMPLNFRYIGYLCSAFPEARIVHMSRDPMALAWSLYRHSFSGLGNGFVYDPVDIARFMVMERDLMAHWRECFPGRIFDLDYQALVTDLEPTTRALAKAVGLEWSPDWLSPEKASNQVLTASAEQVRKPIYRDSNDQWKRYEKQMGPTRDLLVSAGLIKA